MDPAMVPVRDTDPLVGGSKPPHSAEQESWHVVDQVIIAIQFQGDRKGWGAAAIPYFLELLL